MEQLFEHVDGDAVGSSLDHLMGGWTEQEADEMNLAPEEFETIEQFGPEVRVAPGRRRMHGAEVRRGRVGAG